MEGGAHPEQLYVSPSLFGAGCLGRCPYLIGNERKPVKKIRLLAACIAALVVIIICFVGLSGGGNEKSKTEEATVQVVVAKADIPAYSLITADMLSVADVPQSSIPAGVTTYGKVEDVAGSISLSYIKGNETILANHLRDAANATVTPSINTDMRAMTISVTDVTGVADLLRVGNRVDLFYVADDPVNSGSTASTLLVENITVLALDQQVSDSKASENSADSTSSSSSSSSNTTYETVTLHVSLEQAATISAAQQSKGTFYLALRNQSDNNSAGDISASTYDFL